MSNLKTPESWAECTFEDVISFRTGYAFKSSEYRENGVFVLRVTNINPDGTLDCSNAVYISQSDFKSKYDDFKLEADDIIIVMVGATTGKLGIVSKEILPSVLNQNMWKLQPKNNFYTTKKFIYNYLRNIQPEVLKGAAGSATGFIKQADFKKRYFPLPPMQEQDRIVAKIESTQEKIKTIESSISQAESLIEKYRESILQKAFRGQLVPQNPKDEPASKLLERIRTEREKLVDPKKKKKDDLPPIKPEEIPFEIPKSWEWVRLGEVIAVSSGDGLIASNQKKGNIPVFGGNGIAGYHNISNIDSSMIVIGRVGAKCGVVHVTPSKSWVTDNALIVKPKIVMDQKWLAVALSWLNLNADANRSAQPVISGLKIYPRMMPLPPAAEQLKIISAIQAHEQSIEIFKLILASVREKCERMLTNILNSGFAGDLVAQDSSEGTGHELLEQIKLSLIVRDRI